MSPYEEYLVELAPPWLRGRWGEAWHRAVGAPLDRVADSAIAAVKTRFLRHAPDDALPYAGDDRQIERAPSESSDSYRARLLQAFATWRLAGTNKAIVEALRVVGYAHVRIFENKEWNASGDPDAWWLFWVQIIAPPSFGPPWKLGSGIKLGAKLLGVAPTVSADTLHFIRRVIRKWKAAHTICAAIILSDGNGKLLGSGWKLGDGTRIGGRSAFLSL